METEGVKNISVLKIFDYLMLHDPPNWPSVHWWTLGQGAVGDIEAPDQYEGNSGPLSSLLLEQI